MKNSPQYSKELQNNLTNLFAAMLFSTIFVCCFSIYLIATQNRPTYFITGLVVTVVASGILCWIITQKFPHSHNAQMALLWAHAVILLILFVFYWEPATPVLYFYSVIILITGFYDKPDSGAKIGVVMAAPILIYVIFSEATIRAAIPAFGLSSLMAVITYGIASESRAALNNLDLIRTKAQQRRDELFQTEKELQQAVAHGSYLNKQLNASMMLSQNIASILDLDELLESVTNLIQKEFQFMYVGIFKMDSATETLTVANEAGRTIYKKGEQTPVPLDAGNSLSEAAANGQVVYVPDITDSKYMKHGYMQGTTHSEIVFPLARQRTDLFGVLNIQSSTAVALNDDTISTLQSLSDQVSISIQNAYYYKQVVQFTRELETVAEVGTAVSTFLNLSQLMQTIIDLMQSRFDIYHVQVYLYDDENEDLVLAAAAGDLGRDLLEAGWKLSLDKEAILTRVARERQEIIVNDVQQSEDWMPNPSLPDTKSEMGVPLLIGTHLVGVLDIQSEKVNYFTDNYSQLFITLGRQLAVAIRNAQLYNESQKHADELAEAKEIADLANKAKSDFLANMSHELRTPLNGILGYAQILGRDHDLTQQQQEGIGVIQYSGEHLLNLINDILDLARIEAGRLEIEPESIHLADYIQSLSRVMQMRAIDKNLAFDVDLAANLPQGIFVDDKRLRQILINLLGNAIKFTDKGKVSLKVTLVEERNGRLSTSNNYTETGSLTAATICFSVQDTGAGMSKADLQRIFSPFERVGDTRKKVGTGLGLAISRQLVEAMDSQLQVESQLGKGSRFWFNLKVPVVRVESNTKSKRTEIISYTGPTQKVLVVDDVEMNCSVISNLLGPIGFEVITAADGVEAVQKTQEEQPTLIIMDMVMPNMTGIEATQAIRADKALQKIPIIAISASAFKEDREESRIAGCDDFLPKPIVAHSLYEVVEKYLPIEWVYADDTDGLTEDGLGTELASSTSDQPIVSPPENELSDLLDLARRGNLRAIAQRIEEIKLMDAKYEPFVQKIDQLLKAYETEIIQSMLTELMEDNSNE